MRKIEQQMIAAVNAGKEWKNDNTETVISDDQLLIKLHGNTIAVKSLITDVLWLDQATFRAYPTRTTVNRLRALGFNAGIKQFAPCINGKPI